MKPNGIRQMTPSEKLKEIRLIEKLSQLEFAEKYSLKENAIAFIERGKQAIPDDLALALEKEYKIPFKWWKTGEGSTSFEQTSEDTVNIPVDYENKGSCGVGFCINDNIKPEFIQLSKFWLKNVLKASILDLMVVFARGDSMEPTIQDGDMLLIDRTQIDLCDGIFLMRYYNGELLVKRICDVTFEIRLISDNKKYDYIPIEKDKFDKEVKIIGKVIWNGSKKNV